jgi:alpha-tubulin suppressor-like RCC1 family protein
MKKAGIISVLFSVLVLAGIFMLAGCWAPVNVEKPENGPIPADMAKVRIPLPGASNARAVGLAGAQKHANFFEVSLRESVTGAVISKNAALSRGYIDVVIPPGIYDILLFAGDNRQNPASPLLLATSHAQNVDIIAGRVNDVYMTLVTFDLDLTALPPVVKLNAPFTAGFTVKPRNPLIAPADGGSVFPHKSSTISVDGVTGDIDETGWGYDGVTYTYTASVSVKSLTGSEKAVIGFTGYIGMFDETPETTPVWTYADFGHPELGGYYKKEVTVDRNADTNIIIDWERPDEIKAMASGDNHTVVIKTDGSLWAWGRNQNGQFGNGTTTGSLTPVRIGTDTDWQTVDAEDHYTVALKTDGSIWAWGRTSYGLSGTGRIGNDTDWQGVNTGARHAVAIKTDGSLWAWGNNSDGRLGNGTTISSNTPVRIGTDTDWQIAVAGDRHTVAIKTNGSLWAWGGNNYGQVGDGTTTNRNTPVRIGTDTNWQIADIGAGNTVALKTDGSLWAWGHNNGGQLGDGTKSQRNVPNRIGNDTDWQAVDAGFHHTIAVKTDGSLWAWGWNHCGQVGDGTTTSHLLTPVRIGTDTGWKTVQSAGYNSKGVRNDGSFWAWGNNAYGEIGDGTTTNSNTPVKITF